MSVATFCSRRMRLAGILLLLLVLPSSLLAQTQLEEGAQGAEVETLQRTLNARLQPPPRLSVDGDFGPRTSAALRLFQKQAGLPVTGRVDPGSWKALRPLITACPPAPSPEAVKATALPLAEPDSLVGPPFVTCKAWAIVEPASGKLLWGSAADKPLDMASTTKIMTAYLVLQRAAKDPQVLKQEVRFSRRADQTRGSTAGIREGEALSVGELLYGLLLPSGNDASVALAEHFGKQFSSGEARSEKTSNSNAPNSNAPNNDSNSPNQPPAEPAEANSTDDPLQRFVDQMNRAAAELQLEQTQFRNPHGLTAEGHHASAHDLARLASAALKLPGFADYVRTRRHGCAVRDPEGKSRNVVWKNTNQLLGIEGYRGVKTGTTGAAGACLVSLGSRGDDELLIVVLGSAASAARYTDTRNLFRWAWQQRASNH